MFGVLRRRSRPPVACRQRSPSTSNIGGDHAVPQARVRACGPGGGVRVRRPVRRRSSPGPPVRARSYHERGNAAPHHDILGGGPGPFSPGSGELDLTRFIDANAHFKQAVAADPDFAFAYLSIANAANSLAEFKSNLALAEQHAGGASEAERLQIQMVRKGFDQDLAGQLALGQQLVQKYPDSPRAWLALAGVQIGLNRNEEARASIAKALALAPRMFVAHTTLGFSYVFGEPRDFTT